MPNSDFAKSARRVQVALCTADQCGSEYSAGLKRKEAPDRCLASLSVSGEVNLGDDGSIPFGDVILEPDAVRCKVNNRERHGCIKESLLAVEGLDVPRGFTSFCRREWISL